MVVLNDLLYADHGDIDYVDINTTGNFVIPDGHYVPLRVLTNLTVANGVVSGRIVRLSDRTYRLDTHNIIGRFVYVQCGFRGGVNINADVDVSVIDILHSPRGNLGVSALFIAYPNVVYRVQIFGRLYGAHNRYNVYIDDMLNLHADPV